MNSPTVSVVMPVYNAANFIGAAISSILAQSFRDLELIVIDDCSTDETLNVVRKFEDPRMRVIKNGSNMGRAASDNAAMPNVRGKYVAKMDADDISLPRRIQKQVEFLDKNKDIDVVGSWMQNFGSSTYLNKYPSDPDLARCWSVFTLPVGNPSVMLRTRLFTERGFTYNPHLRQSEDFEFFSRYAQLMTVASIPEPLVLYRTYPTVRPFMNERAIAARMVRERLLERWGLRFSLVEAQYHHAIAESDISLGPTRSFEPYHDWLRRLLAHNSAAPWFQKTAFESYLAEKWFNLCYLNPSSSFRSVRAYVKSPLSHLYRVSPQLWLKFVAKATAKATLGVHLRRRFPG